MLDEGMTLLQIFDSALNLLGRRRFDSVFRPFVYDLFIAGEEKASSLKSTTHLEHGCGLCHLNYTLRFFRET